MVDKVLNAPRAALAAIVVLVLASLGMVTAVIISGRDPSVLVALIATAVVPTVTSLFVYLKVDAIDARTQTISKNVNGHLTALSKRAGIIEDATAAKETRE